MCLRFGVPAEPIERRQHHVGIPLPKLNKRQAQSVGVPFDDFRLA